MVIALLPVIRKTHHSV